MKGPFGEKGYYSRDVAGKTVGFLVSQHDQRLARSANRSLTRHPLLTGLRYRERATENHFGSHRTGLQTS